MSKSTVVPLKRLVLSRGRSCRRSLTTARSALPSSFSNLIDTDSWTVRSGVGRSEPRLELTPVEEDDIDGGHASVSVFCRHLQPGSDENDLAPSELNNLADRPSGLRPTVNLLPTAPSYPALGSASRRPGFEAILQRLATTAWYRNPAFSLRPGMARSGLFLPFAIRRPDKKSEIL